MEIKTVKNITDFPKSHYQIHGREAEAVKKARQLGAEVIYKYTQSAKMTLWAIPCQG